MTDHTIQANFDISSNMDQGGPVAREQRIIEAMAKAIGGENYQHPMVVFEVTKIYRAVKAMLEAK